MLQTYYKIPNLGEIQKLNINNNNENNNINSNSNNK